MSANGRPVELDMPASPIPVHAEIRDAAAGVIQAEQWLQDHGWRRPLAQLSSADSAEWLQGYIRFRALLDTEHVRARMRGVVEGAAVALAVCGVVIGVVALV